MASSGPRVSAARKNRSCGARRCCSSPCAAATANRSMPGSAGASEAQTKCRIVGLEGAPPPGCSGPDTPGDSMRIAVIEKMKNTEHGLGGRALNEAGAEIDLIRAHAGEPLPADVDGHD